MVKYKNSDNFKKPMDNSQRNGLIYLMLFIMGFLFLANFSSGQLQTLGTAKISEQYEFCQVCSDATYITLSSIQTPNSTTQINTNMTATGSGQWCYNYTPTQIGRYDFRGVSDGCTGEFATYVDVTYTGYNITSEQTTFVIIGIVVLLIVAAFFFILSYLFKHPGTKIFLMALSSLTMIIVIGLVSSNANIYLSEFPTIVSFYSKYYIFMTYMAWAVMLGIVGWLIYYSLKLFNKSRGIDFDD